MSMVKFEVDREPDLLKDRAALNLQMMQKDMGCVCCVDYRDNYYYIQHIFSQIKSSEATHKIWVLIESSPWY